MTAPYYADDSVTLYLGDCLDVLAEMPDNSVDAIVTDPPYGLEFMGKEWDKFDGGQQGRWQGRKDTSERLDREGMGADTLAERLTARPSYGRDSRNRKCRVCNHYKFSGTPCTCETPDWEVRTGTPPNMAAFQQWCQAWTTEALRVLKPGGHLLAFGGTRTWHRLAVAVEDAGFEVRDSIAWLYGSGFPKSLDVSKAIDKAGHLSRPRALEFTEWMRSTGITAAQVNAATGTNMGSHYLTDKSQPAVAVADLFDRLRPLLPEVPERVERLVAERTGLSWADYQARAVVGSASVPVGHAFAGDTYGGDSAGKVVDLTTAHTPAAQQWAGWGTALKPAFEPIVVARKPLVGTVAANVLAHGTGALNVDGCRVATDWVAERGETWLRSGRQATPDGEWQGSGEKPTGSTVADRVNTGGRWPANVLLDGDAAAELDGQTGTLTSGKMQPTHTTAGVNGRGTYGADAAGGFTTMETYGDSGGASRFFPTFRYEAKAPTAQRPRHGEVAHPTVKPLDLMRWLVRLVTPPGGTVLEPFAGSGTTAEACVIEGFRCIAIEREAAYLPLILARLSKPIQPDLFGGAA